jgi:hypothetical protein
MSNKNFMEPQMNTDQHRFNPKLEAIRVHPWLKTEGL